MIDNNRNVLNASSNSFDTDDIVYNATYSALSNKLLFFNAFPRCARKKNINGNGKLESEKQRSCFRYTISNSKNILIKFNTSCSDNKIMRKL